MAKTSVDGCFKLKQSYNALEKSKRNLTEKLELW